jgi:F-type H+-transporting ATPase subunit gamma
MPSLRQIRRRIRSVQSTAKITHALEMIAAFRMRQAQLRVQASRPYAEKIQEVIGRLCAQQSVQEVLHPLLVEHEEKKRIGVIHITPDRGMCGGLDSSLNRFAGAFILEQEAQVAVTCVGRKGRDFMVRSGQDVQAIFTDMGDSPTVLDILPIAHTVISGYENGDLDEVYLVFSRFVSVAVQRPTVEKLLPIEPTADSGTACADYIYEPNAKDVLASLLPRFVEREIYQAMLEAVASEQSARVVAMRNATDNANEMIDELTLVLNKLRQQTITEELLDIIGAAQALGG